MVTMAAQDPVDFEKVEYASFTSRVFAGLLDTLLMLLVLAPILAQVSALFFTVTDPNMVAFQLQQAMEKNDSALFLRIAEEHRLFEKMFFDHVLLALPVIAFWIWRSATPGKMLTRMRIVDATTGGPLTPKQSFIRYVSYFASALPLGLGFTWVIFDPRKQGWHDKLANTVVVTTPRGE